MHSASHIILLVGFVLASAGFLWWGRLPARARRGLALTASAAAIVFLMVALSTAGHREAETTGSFVLGPGYVAGHASASASLPYYVMTAVCLLLGTAGLAIHDSLAHRLVEHPVATAFAWSALATLVRFALEKAAAPNSWTWAIGVTWLAPLVGAYFALRLRDGRTSWKRLASWLLLYGLLARAWVALTYIIATAGRLGSHYDLSAAWIQLRDPVTGVARGLAPGSLAQMLYVVLVPQLLVWPIYTVLAGLLGAAVVFLMTRGVRAPPVRTLPVEMAPAPQDR